MGVRSALPKRRQDLTLLAREQERTQRALCRTLMLQSIGAAFRPAPPLTVSNETENEAKMGLAA